MPRSEQSRARPRSPDGSRPAAEDPAASAFLDHLDAVYRYARRRLPAPDAEDVTQTCAEALLKARAEGRIPEDDGAYLLGVARRRVADRFRRQFRRPPPVQLPEGWEGYGESRLPDDVLADADLRALVRTALGFLPSRDAALLEARYRGGASTAELAERLALTPKAVENRLRRARAAFLGCLRAIGGDWTDAGRRPDGPGEGDA